MSGSAKKFQLKLLRSTVQALQTFLSSSLSERENATVSELCLWMKEYACNTQKKAIIMSFD